jgi:hypothetical protein
MTIHNLDFVEGAFFVLVPLAAGLFGLLGAVLPAVRRRIDRRWASQLSFMLPPWFLSSWFVPMALFALYATFFWGRANLIRWQDQEPLEALLAVGFLAFVLGSLARVQRGAAGSGSREPTRGSASGQPIAS